ncbi:hypothetical protein N801_09540 [Knoellia aerolata DSM 18566]|uniref:Uncharacterized protein n=1 Tax=Knoellia aerolata DSM 18566 TaxID=1385519 RepID=A0A0A0JYF3_9MICO|nr:hypothetical protein N801_09540 [Knoellia aerolata DSM 18566]
MVQRLTARAGSGDRTGRWGWLIRLLNDPRSPRLTTVHGPASVHHGAAEQRQVRRPVSQGVRVPVQRDVGVPHGALRGRTVAGEGVGETEELGAVSTHEDSQRLLA